MNKLKVAYWVSAVLLSLMFFAGAMMYLFNYERAHGLFVSLGFPVWIIYPLAVLKILGAIAVLTRASGFLKELALAGFLYDALLALAAHAVVKDGEYMFSVIALSLTVTVWTLDRRAFGPYRQSRATSAA